jgi:hypothetical protein
VKSDYWNVTDEQLVEKTGKPLAHWTKVLDEFGAAGKKSNDSVAHLQKDHNVPRYWARTLTTRYLKDKGVS